MHLMIVVFLCFSTIIMLNDVATRSIYVSDVLIMMFWGAVLWIQVTSCIQAARLYPNYASKV